MLRLACLFLARTDALEKFLLRDRIIGFNIVFSNACSRADQLTDDPISRADQLTDDPICRWSARDRTSSFFLRSPHARNFWER